MSEILFAPRNDSEAVHLSEGGKSRWRKKILKRGTINYKGRKINFDDEYLKNIVAAYEDGAMDQVPFQIAGDKNEHGLDPKRYGGEADKVFVDEDGDLSADFAFKPETEELVKTNPKLGVSVSLAENPERADGKKYPVVLGHVLGTLDPRVKGLGPWTPVELSGYDADATFVDLSAETLEAPVKTTVKLLPSKENFDLLSEEDIDALSGEDLGLWLKAIGQEPDPASTTTPEPTPVVAPVEGTPVVTALSVTPEERAVELANAAQARAQLDAVRAELATNKYEKLRDMYVGKGVPPAFIELARPLLEVPEDSVINLSEDGTGGTNASDIARQMLDSMAGYVKLGQEKGLQLSVTAEEKPGTSAEDEKNAALLKRMEAEWGN